MNTKFYRSVLKERRNVNRLFSIKDMNGQQKSDTIEVVEAFTEYYTLGTISSDRQHVNSDFLKQGPVVSEELRGLLERPFTREEVKATV